MPTIRKSQAAFDRAFAAVEKYPPEGEEFDKDRARFLQIKLETAREILLQEKRIDEYEAKRAAEDGDRESVQIATGLKELGLDLDSAKSLLEEKQTLSARVNELQVTVSSIQSGNNDVATSAKNYTDAFAIIAEFMSKVNDEARELLGMRLILSMGRRADAMLDALNLSTWSVMTLRTVPELVEFIAKHLDAVGEAGQRVAYCRMRLKVEHKLNPDVALADYGRRIDEERDTRMRQHEHVEFLSQKAAEAERRKRWIEAGANSEMAAMDQREQGYVRRSGSSPMIEIIPPNPR